jgi:hypothetical protein
MSRQNIFLSKHLKKKNILKALTKKFRVRNPNCEDNFSTSPFFECFVNPVENLKTLFTKIPTKTWKSSKEEFSSHTKKKKKKKKQKSYS